MGEEFWAAYRHPLWQKRRLEILERDNWRCLMCDDDGSTLEVHHNFYVKGRKPWEYEDEELETLCTACHGKVKDLQTRLREALCRISSTDLTRAIGYVEALAIEKLADKDENKVLRSAVSYEWLEGAADSIFGETKYWRIRPRRAAEFLARALDENGDLYFSLLSAALSRQESRGSQPA